MVSNTIIEFLSGLPVIGWIIQRLRERSSKFFLTSAIALLASFGVISPDVPGQVNEIIETGQEVVEETGAAIDSTESEVVVIIDSGKGLVDDVQRRGKSIWEWLGLLVALFSSLAGFGSKDAINGEEYEMIIREMQAGN